MIAPEARGAWRDLEIRIRRYAARRVPPGDLDDVTQEIFLRLVKGMDSLRNEQSFGPWVYQVAHNTIADFHRARFRRGETGGETTGEADDLPGGEEENQAEQEVAGFVVPFLAALPPPYREALTLVDLQGMTQGDAAELVGISLPGMKSRVRRGRQMLKESIEACCRIAVDSRGRVMDVEARSDGVLPGECCN
ncbi:MAG: hypothetical protein GMKNLPBB_00355 [Myxococcota bacterium]|nr:hypothetical protein [Myxococcota bacterium]